MTRRRTMVITADAPDGRIRVRTLDAHGRPTDAYPDPWVPGPLVARLAREAGISLVIHQLGLRRPSHPAWQGAGAVGTSDGGSGLPSEAVG